MRGPSGATPPESRHYDHQIVFQQSSGNCRDNDIIITAKGNLISWRTARRHPATHPQQERLANSAHRKRGQAANPSWSQCRHRCPGSVCRRLYLCAHKERVLVGPIRLHNRELLLHTDPLRQNSGKNNLSSVLMTGSWERAL